MTQTMDEPVAVIEEITSRLRERVRARDTKPTSVIKVLTARHGDRKVEWDKGKKEDVEDARATFDQYVKKMGYKAFALDGQGNKGREIKEFDPNVESMLLTPQLRGG